MHLLTDDSRTTSPDASDDALIVAIQAGDVNSVALLFTRYARSLRAIAYQVLRDWFEAEDVVQDIFSDIPLKSCSFDHKKGSVRSWLFKIAYHSAISRRRFLESHLCYGHSRLDTVEGLPGDVQQKTSVPPDLSALERNHLQKLFQSLSENQRRTLELFFCEGYTLDEIAAELGQSKGNIRHHYFRGLEKLRKEVFCKKPQPSAV